MPPIGFRLLSEQDVRALLSSLQALKDAIHDEELVAPPSVRFRLEGAIAALAGGCGDWPGNRRR